jgi:hypothetical protein
LRSVVRTGSTSTVETATGPSICLA